MARYINADALLDKLKELKEEWGFTFTADGVEEAMFAVEEEPTADVAPKSKVAREIFEKIKRSKVMLGHPAKIICFRATPTGEVEEIVEGWVVPQSRIEELEKKHIGGKTDEDISD